MAIHIHVRKKTKDTDPKDVERCKELERKIYSELQSIKSTIPENVTRGEVQRLEQIWNALRKI